MICSNCYDAGAIPKCIDSLAVGGTDIANGSDVIIYTQNLATEKISTYEGFVASGKIFSSEPINLPTGAVLNLWVTEGEDQQNEQADITIGDEDYTCIAFTANNLTAENYDLSV
jgi:hypothetical protein